MEDVEEVDVAKYEFIVQQLNDHLFAEADDLRLFFDLVFFLD